MTLNIDNLVRSAVILAVGLPLSVAATLSIVEKPEVNEQTVITSSLKAKATDGCVKYLLSKSDSRLERESQNSLDEVFGGEVDHLSVCKWVL